ncbi:hypothetical protein ES703_104453 [subsurface metagenome]
MPQQPAPLSTKATVNAFSIGSRHYEQRFNDCGKINCNKCGGSGPRHPSHGPYWYLCVLAKGAWRRIYLGKELDTTRFVNDDGTIDWAAVKQKRILKTYTEQTNVEAPGQLNCAGEPIDKALEHNYDSGPDAGAPPAGAAADAGAEAPDPDPADPIVKRPGSTTP